MYNPNMADSNSDKLVGVVGDHIVATPGICGGRPRINGHRITVQNIAIWHERGGLTPDEIVADHPGITLADVHAALAYYWDHVEEIRADIQAAEKLAEELGSRSTSLVEEKLRQHGGEGDSVSP
jgi:uncharacterized protein (DUF433 family)